MSVVDAVMTVITRMLRVIIWVDSLSAPGGTRCPVLMSVMIRVMTVIVRIMSVIVRIMSVIAGDDRLSILDCELPVGDR